MFTCLNRKLGFLVFFFVSFFATTDLFATHEMGGLITWDCQSNGQYIFRLQMYRDCSGTGFPANLNLTVHNHPTINSIPMLLVDTNDLTSQCGNCTSAIPGAVEEFIYESALISLPGIPGPQGWSFSYDICCRNPTISNLNNPSVQSYSFRSNMYSYNGQSADPCYDSSPRFADIPDFAICTGFPRAFDNQAYDPELDSLVYAWASAFDQFNSSVIYDSAYSYDSPFPNASIDTNNVAASLNIQTGQVEFTSFTSGRYVSVICVRSYKCNQLVAEVFREINTDLINGCILQGSGNINFPPIVTSPFSDSTGAFTKFEKVFAAGDTIQFFMSATDPDWDPVVGGLQTVTMDGFFTQFVDSLLYPVNGCALPPCATTNPSIPTSAPFGAGINFEWATTCDHFVDSLCQDTINYLLSINAFDNYCPVPATNYNLITLKLINPDAVIVEPPVITFAQTSTGFPLNMIWNIPPDPYGLFEQYLIYISGSPSGPFTLLDSIQNYQQTTYQNNGPFNLYPIYYIYMITQTRSCDFNFNYSDSSSVITVFHSGLGENPSSNLVIYPNPATESIFIDLRNLKYRDVEIGIFDSFGREVKQYYFKEGENIDIPINLLADGLYFVHIESNHQSLVSKFLKVN